MVCLASCLPLSAKPSFDSAAFDQLLSELDRIRQRESIAGGALLVTGVDKLIDVRGFGIDSWTQKQTVTPDRYIRVGSVTKSFTALAFLRLELDDELKLDQSFAGLTGERRFINPWLKTHPVTVAQLLEHTAGLADMSRVEWENRQALPLDEALRLDPESRLLRWPPGLHSSYTNSGAGLAAYAMEVATNRDFEAYLAEQVFEPLGMVSATLQPTRQVMAGLIAGYDRDGKTPLPYWHMLYRPFGAMNARIQDMAPFLQMMLGQGRLDGKQVFPAGSIARMEVPVSTLAARHGVSFGYGLGNYAYVRNGFVFHGHGGDADGYLSHYGYSRDAGLGYFLVINAFRNDVLREMRAAVESALVKGLKPSFAPGVPQPEAELRRLTGKYREVTRRFGGMPGGLNVEYADGRLYLNRSGRRQHMIPLGSGQFRRRFEPVATTVFAAHQGELYLQGPFGNFRREGGGQKPGSPKPGSE